VKVCSEADSLKAAARGDIARLHQGIGIGEAVPVEPLYDRAHGAAVQPTPAEFGQGVATVDVRRPSGEGVLGAELLQPDPARADKAVVL